MSAPSKAPNFFARYAKAIIAFAVLLHSACYLHAAEEKNVINKFNPSVGVLYFPGWSEGVKGLPHNPPWRPIKNFPDREPFLGWYDDSLVPVLTKQLEWMLSYGIDYVVFDWYWGGQASFLDQSVRAYLQVDHQKKPPFSIMWANHDAEPRTIESFNSMVEFWIKNYFGRTDYLQFEGKPVVFIFSKRNLDEKSSKLGFDSKTLAERAQKMARDAGLPGIYFIFGVSADTAGLAEPNGADAYFAYNYHAGPGTKIGDQRRLSRSYDELAQAYKSQWAWFSENSTLPYVIPASSGWDRRPWGGSDDPKHDESSSTPNQFEAHLEAARAASLKQRGNLQTVLVCCWNEYGEGSVVEPTKKLGFQYLERIRRLSPGFRKFGDK